MKKGLVVAFALMGFSFTVTQGLLVRELLVTFFGNELSIGLILGNWLILEAMGSGLLGRMAGRIGAKASSFAALQVLFSLFLPLSVYAAYTIRSVIGAIPGEGIGLFPIFYSSFFILIPLALVDGAMFAFGCKVYSLMTEQKAPAIGRVYIYEALGAIIGGIVFTYLFIPYLSSVQMILALAALNLASAASLLISSWGRRSALSPGVIAVLILLAASLYLLFSPRVGEIHRWVVRRQWKGYDLVGYQNSVYGNVTTIRQEGQYTFFANGLPILTVPIPDIALVEEMVHLPLLFHPAPKNVLVISGGVGGILKEIIKYPVEAVDYAELDPLLIQMAQKFITPLTAQELGDPRVKVEHIDGRLLVRRIGWASRSHPEEGYDLIIVNLPYPLTLQLNRFYTLEFFQMIGEILAGDGILVINSPGTLTYMSEELRDLNAVLYQTLKAAFPHVHPIPGDLNLWLASPSASISAVTPEALVQRWGQRALKTQLMTEFHIRYKLDERRLDWFWESLRGSEEIRLNEDLHPVGLFYGLSYWNALFAPHLNRYFRFLSRLNLWALSVPIVLLTVAFLVAGRLSSKVGGAAIPIAIVSTGFTGMTFDLVIIFAFQTLYGYVYHQIGLLITAFMAGLSLGGLLMTSRLERIKRERSLLIGLELSILLYWAALPMVLSALYAHITRPLLFAAIQVILLFLNSLAGFLVGLEFPLANKIYLREGGDLSGTAGALYAVDLLGAFAASVVVSVALIPVLGILETCVLVALLKLGSLVLIITLKTTYPPLSGREAEA